MPLPIPSSLAVWARGPHAGIWFAVCIEPGAWVFGCCGEPPFVTAALRRVQVDEPVIIREAEMWIVYLSIESARVAYNLAITLEDGSAAQKSDEHKFTSGAELAVPPGLSSTIADYVASRSLAIAWDLEREMISRANASTHLSLGPERIEGTK